MEDRKRRIDAIGGSVYSGVGGCLLGAAISDSHSSIFILVVAILIVLGGIFITVLATSKD